MTTLSDASLRDSTRRRDAQQVRQLAVDFTQAEPWLEALNLHLDDLDTQDVWLSINGGSATVEQVAGKWVPGPERMSPNYQMRAVHASFRAGGVLYQLSAVCGVTWSAKGPPPTEVVRLTSEQTARRISEVRHKLEAALSPLRVKGTVRVLTGGSAVLHDLDEAWLARMGDSIEPFPQHVCATCGVNVYFSNGRWRDEGGAYEVLREATCITCKGDGERKTSRGLLRCPTCHGTKVQKVLDHEHEVPDAEPSRTRFITDCEDGL